MNETARDPAVTFLMLMGATILLLVAGALGFVSWIFFYGGPESTPEELKATVTIGCVTAVGALAILVGAVQLGRKAVKRMKEER